MFMHNKRLMYTVRVGAPDARMANLILEQFGGADGELAAQGRLELDQLVSHVFAVERAPEAFRLLDERPEETVQVVLDFS
jgi:hypothetical protein